MRNNNRPKIIFAALSLLALAVLCSLAYGRAHALAQVIFNSPTRGSNGSNGSAGTNGTNGTNGSSAIATSARMTTDTSGFYAWTYPAACVHGGNIPALTAIAEGPNPQAGVNANVQLEGAPTTTTASFRVTKTQNTTVALLGLTITVSLTGTSVGATILDLGCSPQ